MAVFVNAHASPTMPKMHSDIYLVRDIFVYVEFENQMRQRPKEDALQFPDRIEKTPMGALFIV